MDLLATCRKALSLDTTPDHGTVFAAEYFVGLAQQAGLHCELQRGPEPDRDMNVIIWGNAAEKSGKPWVLQAHLDTVDPGPHALWTQTEANPFHSTIHGDHIYGLGAADGKLDFVCKLAAVIEASKKNLRTPFAAVGTFGGETMDMVGAELLCKHPRLGSPQGIFVSAPTGMHLVQASNGAIVFEIFFPFTPEELIHREQQESESTSTHSRLFQGKAAHSSTPHLGESAIKKLIEYLGQLPDRLAIINLDGGKNYNTVPAEAFLEIDLTGGFSNNVGRRIFNFAKELERIETDFIRYPAEGFSPAVPTGNLGLLRTTREGVVLGVSWRLPPSVSNEVLDGWLIRLKSESGKVGATFTVRKRLWPYQLNPHSSAVKATFQELQGVISQPRTFQKSLSTEGSVFSAAGMDCVVMGPGLTEGNSHCPNEFNSIQELQRATEVYKKILERLCQ